MNALQFLVVLATILVVGHFGFKVLTQRIEAAVLKRGDERVVVFKNHSVDLRNSTGNVWEETITEEPGVSLITQLQAIIDAYIDSDVMHLSSRLHPDVNWLWVEMVRTTNEFGEDKRIFVARMAQFPTVTLRHLESTRCASPNGDHEPVLAAVGTEVGDSTR
ncbi:MAG: hypothetical protein AAB351_03475 [Patescibacteria group bacterium]